MKRKIIQIANSTQLISLPRKWCLSHKLEKGDELEVEEAGSSLVISTEKQVQFPTVEVDMSGLDRTSILYLLRSLYKRGYDEIELKYNKPTTKYFRTGEDLRVIQIIHNEVNKQPGMEIIQERDTYCTIKAISNADTSELDNVIRRIFILIIDACDNFVRAGQKNDKVLLDAVGDKHDSITRFISYSLRLINRNPKAQKSDYFLYHIIGLLDKVIDVFNVGSRDLRNYDKKLSKKTVEILDFVTKSIDVFYKLYYRWDSKLVVELNNYREEYKNQYLTLLKTIPPEEISLLSSMLQVFDLLRALSESRMAMEY